MRDAESRAAKEHRSCPGRNHFVAELSRTCFEKSLIYQLLPFAFDDQSGGILVLLKKKKKTQALALSLSPSLPLYKAIEYICSFLSSKKRKKEKKGQRDRIFQQRKDRYMRVLE